MKMGDDGFSNFKNRGPVRRDFGRGQRRRHSAREEGGEAGRSAKIGWPGSSGTGAWELPSSDQSLRLR